MIHQLIITYDDQNGNVNVNGPIANKGLSYLMLECARDAIKDNADKTIQPPIIVPPTGNGLPAFVRKAIRKHKR